ncbi:HAD-IIA family hydrolase [Nocardioides sp. CPCC 205120]|uniref:HAD-IIA family hydrolase n=1 Tax=Nocardioides sp. CPCC 205120 TaxID=3406462 RepID=UPI003B50BB22
MLATTEGPLGEAHDLVMLDLDGVVYVGGEGVPGAAAHLAEVRSRGTRLAFVTNNASRPPGVVAAHLGEVGVPAEVADVVTSAQAAAVRLHARWGAGARVVALGAAGLVEALEEVGLVPVGAEDEAVAVATGYGPDVVWRDLMTVAVRIRDGLPWTASNTDGSIPTPRGPAPGHGVLVAMLQGFTGVTPEVAGKPSPPLLETTIERCAAERPLMVGDRLDTDIDGGIAVDVPTLLVMTGVSGLADLATCAAGHRPSYLAADLGGLLEPQPAVEVVDGRVDLGGWSASVPDGRLVVEARTEPAGTPSDWWRAASVALWHHLDTTGEPADVTAVHRPGLPPYDGGAGR